METWAQRLNCQTETESVAEGSISAFKDTPLLFLMYLHAVELLYKHNITLSRAIWLYIGTLWLPTAESQPCQYTAVSHGYSCDIADIDNTDLAVQNCMLTIKSD